jgi:hypothetical protein
MTGSDFHFHNKCAVSVMDIVLLPPVSAGIRISEPGRAFDPGGRFRMAFVSNRVGDGPGQTRAEGLAGARSTDDLQPGKQAGISEIAHHGFHESVKGVAQACKTIRRTTVFFGNQGFRRALQPPRLR